MLSSKSGKVITLAALPTHSTTTVASICRQREGCEGRTCSETHQLLGGTLTCPIPTQIEEGKLEEQTRSFINTSEVPRSSIESLTWQLAGWRTYL